MLDRTNPQNVNDDPAALALTIRRHLEAAAAASATVLHHYLNAGDALTAAQACVSTNWKKWLRANCFLSVRTALLYQQLSRHRDEIEAEISRFPELSLRAARRLITKPKSKPVAESAEEPTEESAPTAGASGALLNSWRSASDDDRRTFLEQIAVEELLAALPDAMRRDLVNRVVGNFVRQLPEKKRRSVQSHQRKLETERLLAMPAAGSA